jgi:streptomycin 6-kinase
VSGAVVIPAEFVAHIRATFGEGGDAWLRALPSLVKELATRWELEIDSPFDLSYGYVVAARLRDGSEVVLKVGGPDPDTAGEIPALRAYEGQPVCRLLEADEEHAAVLLERVRPGNNLVSLALADDEAATRIAANLMRALWRPPSFGAPFEDIAVWFHEAFRRHRAYYGGPGPFSEAMLARAEFLARELLESTTDPVLLHGDFHHYNMLASDRGWIAIDPKGMIGDRGYEPGPFLGNPSEGDLEVISAQLLDRRLRIFAEELEYDRQRLRDWGVAHAVLSACWSAENGGSRWRRAVHVAQLLSDL